MVWLGINPASEPESSVEIVASEFGILPWEVLPSHMAEYYNVIDPSVSQLILTPETKTKLLEIVTWAEEEAKDF